MLVLSNDFLDIQATIECRITLKRVRDMTRTIVKCTLQISTINSAQLFDQFQYIVECSVRNYVVEGSSPVVVTKNSDLSLVLGKEFLDIEATVECGFTLKCVRDMKRKYSQCAVQISSHNSGQSFGQFS